jgi:trehalose 6-phosphate phosphatase
VDSSGLVAHPGRFSIELRPPLAIDKGTVVRRLSEGCSATCFLGDDLGDLPAFAELGRLRSAGLVTVGVAAVDPESAAEVADAADLVVSGPAGALMVLEMLAGDGSGGG